MKKLFTTMLIAAAAFTACVQNDEVAVPNNNDKITFTATVTAPESRTVLVGGGNDTYHAEWAVGDEINIYEATLSGTTRAKTASIVPKITTAGKTATITGSFSVVDADKFYYVMGSPCMSMNGKATTIAFTLPAQQAPTAMNALDGGADVIVSKIVELYAQPTEPVTFATTRISSIAKVSVKVPTALAADDAVKSVTFACDNDIAGKYGLKWDSVYAETPLEGYTDSASDKSITVTLPTAQSADFSYYMGLWETTLAKDSKVTVTLLTNNDKKFVKEITLTKDLAFTTGDMTTFTVNMSAVKEYVEQTYEPIEGTVNVAGIYWALGNLEYEVDGTTDEGFAAGWRIAPTQYHHFHIDKTTEDKTTDLSKMAHFNFGGIGGDGSHSLYSNGYIKNADYTATTDYALHLASNGSVTDISGKMFTDASCTTPTTNYAEAQYGDIAFWASKGQYRMPTAAEFEKLYADACRTLATYKYTEGDAEITVNGTYFYNPGSGENAGPVEGTKEVTVEDLKNGLFLPHAGRGYDNGDKGIYNINGEGYYRTSTVHSNSEVSPKGYGVVYRVAQLSEGSFWKNTARTSGPATYAFGACARNAIRPVYIAE